MCKSDAKKVSSQLAMCIDVKEEYDGDMNRKDQK